MSAADWPAVEKIYGDGIATGDATFEIEPPSWEEFDRGRRSSAGPVVSGSRGSAAFGATRSSLSDARRTSAEPESRRRVSTGRHAKRPARELPDDPLRTGADRDGTAAGTHGADITVDFVLPLRRVNNRLQLSAVRTRLLELDLDSHHPEIDRIEREVRVRVPVRLNLGLAATPRASRRSGCNRDRTWGPVSRS